MNCTLDPCALFRALELYPGAISVVQGPRPVSWIHFNCLVSLYSFLIHVLDCGHISVALDLNSDPMSKATDLNPGVCSRTVQICLDLSYEYVQCPSPEQSKVPFCIGLQTWILCTCQYPVSAFWSHAWASDMYTLYSVH